MLHSWCRPDVLVPVRDPNPPARISMVGGWDLITVSVRIDHRGRVVSSPCRRDDSGVVNKDPRSRSKVNKASIEEYRIKFKR